MAGKRIIPAPALASTRWWARSSKRVSGCCARTG